MGSVEDPDRVDTDLDPTFQFDADPEPAQCSVMGICGATGLQTLPHTILKPPDHYGSVLSLHSSWI
jgi:hypothetical protein